jgi:hypothetical protein
VFVQLCYARFYCIGHLTSPRAEAEQQDLQAITCAHEIHACLETHMDTHQHTQRDTCAHEHTHTQPGRGHTHTYTHTHTHTPCTCR